MIWKNKTLNLSSKAVSIKPQRNISTLLPYQQHQMQRCIVTSQKSKCENGKFSYIVSANVEDEDGIILPYRQITLVAKLGGNRWARVLHKNQKICEIFQESESDGTWLGYAHFILENEMICVLNFHTP